MEEKELRQIFYNKFDCYTDVDRGEGYKSEMAMSEETFIEVVKLILPVVVRQSEQLKEKDVISFDEWKKECTSIEDNSTYIYDGITYNELEILGKYKEFLNHCL